MRVCPVSLLDLLMRVCASTAFPHPPTPHPTPHIHACSCTHTWRLRHALSFNTPPLTEGRFAHLWLLTPGASHLLSASICLSVSIIWLCLFFPHLGFELYSIFVYFCHLLFAFEQRRVFPFFPPHRGGFTSSRFKPRSHEDLQCGKTAILNLVFLNFEILKCLRWAYFTSVQFTGISLKTKEQRAEMLL